MLASGPGEGRPLLALESRAVGTPVLADVRSAAMSALADEDGAGIHLVDPSDERRLDEAVGRILKLPRKRLVIGSWEETAASLVDQLAHTAGHPYRS
jgi:glycosyltransferase involved in cell wall biosynthesis